MVRVLSFLVLSLFVGGLSASCLGGETSNPSSSHTLKKMQYIAMLALDYEVCCGGPVVNFGDFASTDSINLEYKALYREYGSYKNFVPAVVESGNTRYSYDDGLWLDVLLGRNEAQWNLIDPYSPERRNFRYYLIRPRTDESWNFIIVSNGPDKDEDIGLEEIIKWSFEENQPEELLTMGDLVVGIGELKFNLAGSDFDDRARALLANGAD